MLPLRLSPMVIFYAAKMQIQIHAIKVSYRLFIFTEFSCDKVNFFHSSLCNLFPSFESETVFVPHQHFGYCCTGLAEGRTKNQGFLSNLTYTQASRLGVGKRLEGDTAGTSACTDLTDIPCNAMLSNKISGKWIGCRDIHDGICLPKKSLHIFDRRGRDDQGRSFAAGWGQPTTSLFLNVFCSYYLSCLLCISLTASKSPLKGCSKSNTLHTFLSENRPPFLSS